MDKDNLVLCTQSFQTETEQFKKGKFYRHMNIEDQHLVYGVVFDLVHFVKHFQFAHTIIMDEWESIGILKDGKPVTKTAFKSFLDMHKYGRGKNSYYVAYVAKNHVKELCYQFSTSFAENKTNSINDIYQNFINVVYGHMEAVDSELICRGNSGIPISGGNIYWKEFEKTCTG